jgi:hypothetical protein
LQRVVGLMSKQYSSRDHHPCTSSSSDAKSEGRGNRPTRNRNQNQSHHSNQIQRQIQNQIQSKPYPCIILKGVVSPSVQWHRLAPVPDCSQNTQRQSLRAKWRQSVAMTQWLGSSRRGLSRLAVRMERRRETRSRTKCTATKVSK